jgi:thioredoxin 1
MSQVSEITELNEIPKEGGVVVDFYATWCGPCKKLSPLFEQLSNEFTTIKFLKVNVDEAEEVAKHYDVSALPTVLFIKDGEVVSIIKGFSEQALREQLKELI